MPSKLFYTLADIEGRWPTSASDVRYRIISGELRGATWLPVMSVFERNADDGPENEQSTLCHWEGHIQLSGHQCRRLFKHGRIALREFHSFNGERYFQLPEPADDIIVSLDDLVILEEERMRFEAKYSSNPPTSHQPPGARSSPLKNRHLGIVIESSYRTVHADGSEYHLGEIQANVLRLLFEAAQQGKPWQSGKALLHAAGSQSYSLSNVFKRHPLWKKLIQSDRRGFYRLHECCLR